MSTWCNERFKGLALRTCPSAIQVNGSSKKLTRKNFCSEYLVILVNLFHILWPLHGGP
jgi:hypothetical protein